MNLNVIVPNLVAVKTNELNPLLHQSKYYCKNERIRIPERIQLSLGRTLNCILLRKVFGSFLIGWFETNASESCLIYSKRNSIPTNVFLKNCSTDNVLLNVNIFMRQHNMK